MDEDKLRVIKRISSLSKEQLEEFIARIYQLQLEGRLPPFEADHHYSTDLSTQQASA